jgi:tRNA(fMet)-specific endonuclease VapC
MTPELFLLDTNMVGYIAGGHSSAARQSMSRLHGETRIAVSAITEGEILYGLALKPQAVRLRVSMESLLSVLEILPWDSEAALSYGTLRAHLRVAGKTLSALDMLIASHAVARRATLVTADAAFSQVGPLLPTVNWANDI